MNGPLIMRHLIPSVTARTAEGKIVRGWDYKQERNLVIAFLHSDCARCDNLTRLLVARSNGSAYQSGVRRFLRGIAQNGHF